MMSKGSFLLLHKTLLLYNKQRLLTISKGFGIHLPSRIRVRVCSREAGDGYSSWKQTPIELWLFNATPHIISFTDIAAWY